MGCDGLLRVVVSFGGFWRVVADLEFHVRPEAEYVDGASVLVVRRVVHELVVEGEPDTAEKSGVIVCFYNCLVAIIQCSISDDEAITAGFQKSAVIGGNAVDDSSDGYYVIISFPTLSF